MNILITGVSSGLGKAFLACHGTASSVYGMSRSAERPHVFRYDEIALLPPPSVLVLNAAVGDYGLDFQQFDASKFEHILQVNLVQPLSLLAEMHQHGKLTSLRALIVIGSRFSSTKFTELSEADELPGYGYCLSKIALAQFIVMIRKEKFSFASNIVHPGVLQTDLGSQDGWPAALMAKKLHALILDSVFDKEFPGIYNLPTDELIPF
ncbi:MAG: hypothetical protein EBS17_02480 [Flavobacteriia bacterium]|nr:hypothetical protein [Flavobacteriia bacterium]